MMNPRQNAELLRLKISEVKAHPMCLEFFSCSDCYEVRYPAGFALSGARAVFAKNGGKLKALDRLLDAMERHWVEGGL